MSNLTSLEICAGGGGQALGLEQAGFDHVCLVEIDKHSCNTLRLNRPEWDIVEGDLADFDGRLYKGIDLLAGGLPCPPFSVAGKQLGKKDERDLFPEAIRLVDEIRPRAVMIENVRGLLGTVFTDYRDLITAQLKKLGYVAEWQLLNASDFGVPQLRPRALFIAIRQDISEKYSWPRAQSIPPPTVGETLYDMMASRKWKGAKEWREQANEIAPTIVGGSLKHGGPDLGPTRSKRAWAALGVDGHAIADTPPGPDFAGMPRLTVRMVARIQGFPDTWEFSGRKTPAYRQVGNAFPPPVAKAVAMRIRECLTTRTLIQAKAV